MNYLGQSKAPARGAGPTVLSSAQKIVMNGF